MPIYTPSQWSIHQPTIAPSETTPNKSPMFLLPVASFRFTGNAYFSLCFSHKGVYKTPSHAELAEQARVACAIAESERAERNYPYASEITEMIKNHPTTDW